MEYQSLIEIVPWTFVFQILNLLLQAYLFKRFLFQPVKKIIEKRKSEIDAVYSDATQAKFEADAAKTEYETKLITAQSEADAITRKAMQTAQTRGEEVLRTAKAEASALKEKTSADIQLERKKAVNEMKDEISQLAVEIASKVAHKEISEKDHEALIDQFIEGLGDAQ